MNFPRISPDARVHSVRDPMIRRSYGPRAWMLDEVERPAAWAAALARLDVAGVVEIVPAESTVVVQCERGRHAIIGELLDAVEADAVVATPQASLVLDVVYDGPDIAALAALTGLTSDDVVRRHAGGDYEVAFCGFSPGFGYLRGLDPRLDVPRRETPRRSVPVGSIGVAAGYTCVYPSASPGGWHLIGRTATELWNVDHDPPALLTPGRLVRFHDKTP